VKYDRVSINIIISNRTIKSLPRGFGSAGVVRGDCNSTFRGPRVCARARYRRRRVETKKPSFVVFLSHAKSRSATYDFSRDQNGIDRVERALIFQTNFVSGGVFRPSYGSTGAPPLRGSPRLTRFNKSLGHCLFKRLEMGTWRWKLVWLVDWYGTVV